MDRHGRKASPGQFRIVGYDQNDYTDFFVNEFDDLNKALEEAEVKRAVPNAVPTSMSTIYYIYNDQGKLLYRATYDGGIEKC